MSHSILTVRDTLRPCVWLLGQPIHGCCLLTFPWLGNSRRFEPSCSAHALDAVQLHGTGRAPQRTPNFHILGGSGIDNLLPK